MGANGVGVSTLARRDVGRTDFGFSHPRRLSRTASTITMTRAAGTEGFGFNHTMIRVKDPKASLEFYQVSFSRLAYDVFENTDTRGSECARNDPHRQCVPVLGG